MQGSEQCGILRGAGFGVEWDSQEEFLLKLRISFSYRVAWLYQTTVGEKRASRTGKGWHCLSSVAVAGMWDAAGAASDC